MYEDGPRAERVNIATKNKKKRFYIDKCTTKYMQIYLFSYFTSFCFSVTLFVAYLISRPIKLS